jgi:hypothetical protein
MFESWGPSSGGGVIPGVEDLSCRRTKIEMHADSGTGRAARPRIPSGPQTSRNDGTSRRW